MSLPLSLKKIFMNEHGKHCMDFIDSLMIGVENEDIDILQTYSNDQKIVFKNPQRIIIMFTLYIGMTML